MHSSRCFFLLALTSYIVGDVESKEQAEEDHGLRRVVVGHADGIAAIVEGEIHHLQGDHDELDDLRNGDVLLPPEVGPERGERREEVVRVHGDMNERIQRHSVKDGRHPAVA